ncbi:MAG: DNA-binding domain-containing protein, partial [Pseudobdellovibrionaceae bacterium]|nr:DNA-binding domain-containing protein [Pseudobdellovibrionaceae bacterium]
MRSAPSWLAPFQQSWSEVLQTPLASHQGTLQPSLPPVWLELGVDNSVRDPTAGVADYQRQYWFRLLNHLQTEFPLTARLMGLWSFNHLGIAYLQKFPPRDYDLQAIQRHFVNYLRDVNQSLVWMQAARIDEARSKVFMAPDYETWHWEDARVSHPTLLSLHPAPDWMLIDEDWALMDLCLQLPDLRGEEALPCPEAHAQTQ